MGRDEERQREFRAASRRKIPPLAEADEDFAEAMIADKMTEEFADVAQLVEQLIRNQQVNGSSPFVGSMHSVIQQRMESAPNGRE